MSTCYIRPPVKYDQIFPPQKLTPSPQVLKPPNIYHHDGRRMVVNGRFCIERVTDWWKLRTTYTLGWRQVIDFSTL